MPTPKIITLTPDDFSAAVFAGAFRSIESVLRNRKDSVYEKDWNTGTHRHILGAVGEIAVLKFLNIYKSPTINNFSGADIVYNGKKIEVRHRENKSFDMIVRRNNSPSSVYVMTRGLAPTIEVVGWEVGKNVMKDSFIRDHGGYGAAWFVPQDALRDMEELIDFNTN